jgi:hypothetical protein
MTERSIINAKSGSTTVHWFIKNHPLAIISQKKRNKLHLRTAVRQCLQIRK